VGNISEDAYDWDLIEHLGAEFPQVHFIFIGPLLQAADKTKRITKTFSQPNMHWLGAKPHDELLNYLQCFDVCINPLRVNEHNQRRSPLRLFDYLNTDRPIISTALEEAFNHVPHVSIAGGKEEFGRKLSGALTSKFVEHLESRRAYIAGNTWQCRAAELLRRVRQG
jgi:hypothetical protein